jgi:hypothetical protein
MSKLKTLSSINWLLHNFHIKFWSPVCESLHVGRGGKSTRSLNLDYKSYDSVSGQVTTSHVTQSVVIEVTISHMTQSVAKSCDSVSGHPSH